MVSLLLAPPFGPIAYLALWGGFDTDGATVALGLTMLLKLAFAACLVLAHQRFLQNKGLVVLVLLSSWQPSRSAYCTASCRGSS